jgi:protein ImuB
MCIWLKSWPIDRLRRSGAAPRASRPFVVAATIGNRRLVSAVDDNAAAAGIAPGMSVADAGALRPDLAVVAAAPEEDAAALARLAQWCGRYSPWTAPCRPDGVWLDVSGCAHFHGGEDGLAAEAVARLGALGIAAHAAIADSAGAAWGLARYGGAPVAIVPEGGAGAALAPLPVAALRLDPALDAALVRLGLRRVGDLYALPRPSLVLRFGAHLATRLDQALGRCAEPLSPLPPPPQRWTRRRFAEPIATAEAIAAAAAGLLATLCRALEEAGEGARRLVLSFYRVDGTSGAVAAGTVRPSHAPHHLLRLLQERFDRIDPGLGIEDMVLAAAATQTQKPAQLALDRAGAKEESGDLAALLDRLAARLGPGAVVRPLLRESHWPERAVRWMAPLDPARDAALPPGRMRPVRLLARPEPIEAVAPVPDDPPLLFRWRRRMHRICRAEGPERIAGEWWLYSNELRDYYRVEDEDGRRFWLYRAGLHRPALPAAWFLHGLFA